MKAEYISQPGRLREACRDWKTAPYLAIDTEFVFERTYYPRLGLVQVATAGAIVLVDPLTCSDLTPLAEALAGNGLKLFHSASGDLAILSRALGMVPQPILDTQVAAGLAGLGAGISYQKLVEALLGRLLGKGATRSDWTARPLTPEQLDYAAEDVEDLIAVALELKGRLLELGRWEWALADSRRLVEAAAPQPPENAPSRLRGLERLPPAERAAAESLAVWREKEAMRRDLPRRWVLEDAALFALARHRPATAAEAESIPGIETRLARRDAERWVAALATAQPSDASVTSPARGRPSPRERHLADRLQRVLRRRAEELALPPELLATRRAVDALAASAVAGQPALPVELSGWREEAIGLHLLAAARSASH